MRAPNFDATYQVLEKHKDTDNISVMIPGRRYTRRQVRHLLRRADYAGKILPEVYFTPFTYQEDWRHMKVAIALDGEARLIRVFLELLSAAR